MTRTLHPRGLPTYNLPAYLPTAYLTPTTYYPPTYRLTRKPATYKLEHTVCNLLPTTYDRQPTTSTHYLQPTP